jgi:hypothetical protein
MKTKLALTGLAIAAVATPLTYQQVTLNRVRHENRALQERLAQAQPDEQTPGPSAVNKAELDRIQAERLELMRLRSEVARLREQAANFEAVRREIENLRARIASTPSSGVPAEGADDEAAELEKKVGIAKLNLFKSWGLAFILYADANNGRLPATLDEARPFLPATQETQENQSGLQEIDLELISHPQLNRIQHPSTTILARERTPWVNARGRFARTYVFADGHSEIRASPDGDFDAWEQERGVPAQSTGGSSPESASR